jgi:ZIP family zinc transporter
VTILAAGGILYLVFQKIEPQAKPAMHFAPPLGAAFGSPLGGMPGRTSALTLWPVTAY